MGDTDGGLPVEYLRLEPSSTPSRRRESLLHSDRVLSLIFRLLCVRLSVKVRSRLSRDRVEERGRVGPSCRERGSRRVDRGWNRTDWDGEGQRDFEVTESRRKVPTDRGGPGGCV